MKNDDDLHKPGALILVFPGPIASRHTVLLEGPRDWHTAFWSLWAREPRGRVLGTDHRHDQPALDVEPM